MEVVLLTRGLFNKDKYAFVEYPKLHDAEKAMRKLHEYKLDGFRLAI